MKRTGRLIARITALWALVFTVCLNAPAAEAQTMNPTETPAQRDERMAWWREARFGMFVHWGVYAVPAGTYQGKQIPGIGEWIMLRGKIPMAEYQTYARAFDPVKYDPDQWVRLAKEAGMKYIVITSKHHDGFALFDTQVNDWNVVKATPYGKDLLRPLAAACRKHGLKLGFYYSQAQDWNNGGAAAGGKWDPAQKHDMDDYIDQVAVPQVREILTMYGTDIPAVLWWDTPKDMNEDRAKRLHDVMMELRPDIIRNNRLGGGYDGDTETPEQHIPATGFEDRDWESCMTMNRTWGFKSYDHDWKSTETLVRNLVDIASKGGNYLLNVGPAAEGLIPEPSIERLREIGTWMRLNGESIYGTTASPFRRLPWGRVTTKAGPDGNTTLYFHVFEWPGDGKLVVPGLKNAPGTVALLKGGKRLRVRQVGPDWQIAVPTKAPDRYASVIKAMFKGAPQVELHLPTQQADGTLILPASEANVNNRNGTHAALVKESGIYSVQNWADHRATVSWDCAIHRTGEYEVVADYALGGEVTITAAVKVEGKKTGELEAQPTGGGFQEGVIGTVKVARTGQIELFIQPAKPWGDVRLRSLTLRPKHP